MSEFMILGLRLVKGVSSREFRQRYGEDLQEVFGEKLALLVDAGLLIREGTVNTADLPGECGAEPADVRYRLSTIGLDLANKVFVEFI
jgi:oxygen-independent coproporphyrinogen-3 oxidase